MNFKDVILQDLDDFQRPRNAVPLTTYNIAAESHPGRVRLCNEDSYGYSVGEENTFVAVADGIGGHLYGDVASQTCVKSLLKAWRSSMFGSVMTPQNARQFLCKQIKHANQVVFNMNQDKGLRNPMGTTLVAGCFSKDSLVLAHVGDSRCYRIRNGRIAQITQDHSYVSMLVENNVISAASARLHPFAHVICRSVGVAQNVEPELNFLERQPGDRYLFCSDGALIGSDDSDLESMIYDAETPHEAAAALIRNALCHGGEDNVTVALIFT